MWAEDMPDDISPLSLAIVLEYCLKDNSLYAVHGAPELVHLLRDRRFSANHAQIVGGLFNIHQRPSPILSAFANGIFENKTKSWQIATSTEMYVYARLAAEADHQCPTLVFNMPPGFGKTRAIKDLCRLYGETQVAISAPTAVAAHLYDEAVAKTYHSRYWDVVYCKSRGSVWEHPEKVHVIDECYMCSRGHINEILARLRNSKKTTILVGDSAQLPPVLASSFLPDDQSIVFECDWDRVLLPRFLTESAKLSFCDRVTEFGRLILCLKRLIDQPEVYYPNEQYSVECFKELFYRIFCVEQTENCSDVLAFVSNQQTALCAAYNDSTCLKNGEKVTTRLASYTNELNQEMVPRICENVRFDRGWLECIKDEWGKPVDAPACIVVCEDDFLNPEYSATLTGLCKYTSTTTLKAVPTFFSGMCILNKHNRRDAYNGEKFWVDELACSETTLRTIMVDKTACHVSTYKKGLSFSGYISVNKDEHRTLEYIKYTYCLRCGRSKTREQSCVEMCRAAIDYYELVITPAYVQTIYGLQGCTIEKNVRLRLFSKLVFKRDKLRTLYVLLSRVKLPNQIVVDDEFIHAAIAVILGKKNKKQD